MADNALPHLSSACATCCDQYLTGPIRRPKGYLGPGHIYMHVQTKSPSMSDQALVSCREQESPDTHNNLSCPVPSF